MTGLVYSGHCTYSSTRSRQVLSLREERQRGSSQITLGFLVIIVIVMSTP